MSAAGFEIEHAPLVPSPDLVAWRDWVRAG